MADTQSKMYTWIRIHEIHVLGDTPCILNITISVIWAIWNWERGLIDWVGLNMYQILKDYTRCPCYGYRIGSLWWFLESKTGGESSQKPQTTRFHFCDEESLLTRTTPISLQRSSNGSFMFIQGLAHNTGLWYTSLHPQASTFVIMDAMLGHILFCFVWPFT